MHRSSGRDCIEAATYGFSSINSIDPTLNFEFVFLFFFSILWRLIRFNNGRFMHFALDDDDDDAVVC